MRYYAHNSSSSCESMKSGVLAIETLALKWSGMLPGDTKDHFYNVYSYFIFAVVATSSYCDVYVMLRNVEDTSEFIENFTIGTALLIGSIKIAGGYYMRHNLRECFLRLAGENFRADPKKYGREEQDLQDRYIFLMNVQAGLYYVAPFVYITFANIPSIHLRIVHDNSSHWTLPFGAFPLFDTTNSPNYEIALFYQNACNFITFMCYMTISAAICSTMATLVLCCKILQHRIKTCIHRSTSMKTKQPEWYVLQRNLKEIIKYHISLVNISNELRRMFSVSLLIDFCGLSIVIASCIFYSYSIQEFNFKCVQMLTIVLAAVVSEFMTSYWGSELIKEYQAIGDTCYEIEFVGQDLRFQKMLRFVIQRTRTPLEFTVGGFSPLTMRTFLLVMKGAYSFFMFLRRE